MRFAKGAPGYTLIELVIALGVSVIVIAGALALATAQQRTFMGTSRDRGLQEGTRVAIGQIADNLRYAGYGVDPALAFDLGPTTGRGDRIYGTFATSSTPKSDGSACTGLCRDHTTGPDEIVFYSRDPSFGPHPLIIAANAVSTSLRVGLLPNQTNFDLQKGQVLQLICYTGSFSWAYVSVSGEAADNKDGTATVPIASGDGSFPNQTTLLADPCFSSVASMSGESVDPATMAKAAKVFKIDRYHYYVQAFDAAGDVVAWNTPGSRPYLMLDQGLANATKDGTGKVTGYEPVTSIVAPDVEDLQFAYLFPNDAVTPIVGSSPGVPLTNDDKGINLAPKVYAENGNEQPGCPAYADAGPPTPAPTRLNHHPGNIGAVRVSAVIRSSIPDPTIQDTTIPAIGNRDKTDGEPGYLRVRVETTVRAPNLSSEAPYSPTYDPSSPPPAAGSRKQGNVGGG